MIILKNKLALEKMKTAGKRLSEIFERLKEQVTLGVTTYELDQFIARQLVSNGLQSKMKGYMGYQYVSCISVNDEVVHGLPRKDRIIQAGDMVSVDVCAAWQDYCADMARTYCIEPVSPIVHKMIKAAQESLDAGIAKMQVGNRLGDISAAIQHVVESYGFGVVRDFAGHGIGKRMHEDPEILNYGTPGSGPILQVGMAFALEPMITEKNWEVSVLEDGWTVVTDDGSLAIHVEDTVILTPHGPVITTRFS